MKKLSKVIAGSAITTFSCSKASLVALMDSDNLERLYQHNDNQDNEICSNI